MKVIVYAILHHFINWFNAWVMRIHFNLKLVDLPVLCKT
jgi:hypothetical protein